MRSEFLESIVRWIKLTRQEQGQDLVEYALLAGMIGLGVTASTRSMASILLTVMNQINTALQGYIA